MVENCMSKFKCVVLLLAGKTDACTQVLIYLLLWNFFSWKQFKGKNKQGYTTEVHVHKSHTRFFRQCPTNNTNWRLIQTIWLAYLVKLYQGLNATNHILPWHNPYNLLLHCTMHIPPIRWNESQRAMSDNPQHWMAQWLHSQQCDISHIVTLLETWSEHWTDLV